MLNRALRGLPRAADSGAGTATPLDARRRRSPGAARAAKDGEARSTRRDRAAQDGRLRKRRRARHSRSARRSLALDRARSRKCASRQKNFQPGRAAFFLAAQLQAASRESAYAYGESASGAWHLNTPRLITNQAQQAVWRYDNTEPFADSVPDEDPSSLGAFEFPVRMEGRTYLDRETNLLYNTHRYRDTGIGRFPQADPLGLRAGDLSLYVLTKNNPLSLTDPFGLFTPGRHNEITRSAAA